LKKSSISMLILVTSFLMFLAGCGGGGGGASAGPSTVSGVAAAGAPIIGSVTLKDSASSPNTKTATIAADGSFSIDVSGLTPPFILKATGTIGNTAYTLYSFTQGAGTANVNPFANLEVALASGGLDPAAIYAAPSAVTMQAITGKLPATVTNIQTKLQYIFALYGANGIDPVTSNFVANHTGLDEVLDMMSFNLSAGVITIINKTTNAVIFTTQVSNFTGGNCDTTKVPTPPIRAVVSPIFMQVPLNKSVPFTADVLRSTNKSVTWSVVESGGGTITAAGVYTAPATEGIYHVKATSVANPSLPAIAIVQVTPDNVIVNVTSATVPSGGSKTFIATVTGTSNPQVTWTVVEAGGGSISTSGVYTAPSTAGTYHVTATSVADPTKNATAAVTVTPAGISIDPASTTVLTGGSTTFTATVTGASNTAVTWTVIEAGGGSIASSGLYTAPSTAGTYHVKATSVADTTKSATAAVTVTAPLPTTKFPIGTWVDTKHNITIKVNALGDTFGTDSYYSGSVSYPAFIGGIVNITGQLISSTGAIDFVQNETLAVSTMSASGTNVTSFSFAGDDTIFMTQPITAYSGFLAIVSSTPGYSYAERTTFIKQ